MIKIHNREYYAEQAIGLDRISVIPSQPTEKGFEITDHVIDLPIRITFNLILADDMFESNSTDHKKESYDHLEKLKISHELVTLDCSDDYGIDILDDMVIESLSQLTQAGDTYRCSVTFAQIKQATIEVEQFVVIDRIDEEGNEIIIFYALGDEPPPTAASEEKTLLSYIPSIWNTSLSPDNLWEAATAMGYYSTVKLMKQVGTWTTLSPTEVLVDIFEEVTSTAGLTTLLMNMSDHF